jgi:hypothetical protein
MAAEYSLSPTTRGKAANKVIQLFDNRGIVPFAVEGVNGDDREQYCGRNFEPMVDYPLHAHQVSFASGPLSIRRACSRHRGLARCSTEFDERISLT